MSSGGPRYDLVKNRFAACGLKTQVHASVAFRVDEKKFNNPPVGVMVVDDSGQRLRDFEHV